MNAWKAVCAALVIFLAGIVTGATLVRFAQAGPPRWRIQRPVEKHVPSNPPPSTHSAEPRPPNTSNATPGLLSREFIQKLEPRLHLAPEQREQIGKIISEGQERVRELRARIDPEMRKEFQQAREQIRAVLTPAQREQFEQLMKHTPRRGERGDPPGTPERRFRDQREPGKLPPGDAAPANEPRNPPPVAPPN